MHWGLLLTCSCASACGAAKWLHSRLARRQGSRRQRAATAAAGQQQHRQRQPLRAVVARCEARWFLQELQLATAGDAAAMANVSHMLLTGYGTRQDPAAAARWQRQAWAIQNLKEPAVAGPLPFEVPVRADSQPAPQAQRHQHSSAPAVHALLVL